MIRIGLTGGIGMGKSTVAGFFARFGIPAFNADDEVHRLQAPHGAAIPAIAAAFPGTVSGGVLDRAALRRIVLADRAALRRLEAIMHPLVRRTSARFEAAARRARRRAIILDIPLLFETGGVRRMDLTVTVSCPAATQFNRVRRRGTMSGSEIRAVIAKQMPDAEKRRLADAVIRTGLSKAQTLREVARLVHKLRR